MDFMDWDTIEENYQGAGKRPGQWKKKQAQSRKIRTILPVPIYVFHDSEQKVEF